MALALLDGTNAAIDFTIATNSYKTIASYLSMDIAREFTEQTTFASGGWRKRNPGMKQATGRLDGFLASGTAPCDPLALFASQSPSAFVFTVDTGCTLTGSLHAARQHLGLRAAANSESGLDWESSGTITSAWVVA